MSLDFFFELSNLVFQGFELSSSGLEGIFVGDKGSSVLIKRITELLSKTSDVLLKGR